MSHLRDRFIQVQNIPLPTFLLIRDRGFRDVFELLLLLTPALLVLLPGEVGDDAVEVDFGDGEGVACVEAFGGCAGEAGGEVRGGEEGGMCVAAARVGGYGDGGGVAEDVGVDLEEDFVGEVVK